MFANTYVLTARESIEDDRKQSITSAPNSWRDSKLASQQQQPQPFLSHHARPNTQALALIPVANSIKMVSFCI